MLKKISFSALGILATATPIALGTAYTTKVDKPKEVTYFYDNRYFNSPDEIFNYYVLKYPDLIEFKTVIGDVANALIDFEYGILNRSMLPDFSYDQIAPAYLKSSGQLTPSLSSALKSYANPIFIRERYQGITQLFLTPEKAKKDREDNMMDLYQGFLNIPSFTTKNDTFRFNPLNTADYNLLVDRLTKATTNTNSKFVTSVYQKTLETEKSGVMDSILAGTKYQFLELSSEQDSGATTWPASVDDVKVIKDDEKDEDLDRIDKLSSKNEATKLLPITKDNKIWGWNGMDIKIMLFNLDENGSNDPWTMEAAAGRGSGWAGKDDSGYTNVNFTHDSQKNVMKVTDFNLIKKILEPSSDLANINVITRDSESNNPEDYVDFPVKLANDARWVDFADKGFRSIEALEQIFGSNLDIELKVNLNKDKIANTGSTNFAKHYWYDYSGQGWYDTKHHVREVDSSYFEYHLAFTFNPDVDNVLVNTKDKFLDYYNYQVNYKGVNWSKSPWDLFKDWAQEPYVVNASNNLEKMVIEPLDKDILDNWVNSNEIAQNIKQIPELIQIKDNQVGSSTLFPLFNLKRNSNQSVDLTLAMPTNKKDLILELKKLIPEGTFPETDFTFIDIFEKVLDFLIADSMAIDWNSQANYETLVTTHEENEKLDYVTAFDLFGKMASLKVPVVLGSKDLADNLQAKSIVDVISANLQDLQLYINNKQAKKITINETFLLESLIIHNSRFNLQNTITFIKKEEYLLPSDITFGNGKYLLMLEQWFNSSLMSSGSSNLGGGSVFINQIDYQSNKSLILKTNPPLVRIMYNIDGEVVMGNVAEKIEDPRYRLYYDDEDVFLYNAESIADIRYNHDYVYYEWEDGRQELILNQQASIYTLKIDPTSGNELKNKRYFQTYSGLKKYVLNQLMLSVKLIW